MHPTTIFALATPFAVSAVGIIRLSGDEAFKALQALTRSKPNKDKYVSRIYDIATNQVIDKCLILTFKAPHSFTGEDCVEIQCHGSIAIIRKILHNLSQLDYCRFAKKGEFTQLALINGKMSLLEVETLGNIIQAKTEQDLAINNAIYYSTIPQLTHWRQESLSFLALNETLVDFPDEEIPPSIQDRMFESLNKFLALITLSIHNHEKVKLIRQGIEIAFIGLPNVGKSSLLNALSDTDTAIVSDIPGTTRDLIKLQLHIDGFDIQCIDTAGIRETTDILETKGIEKSLQIIKTAFLRLWIVDASNWELTWNKFSSEVKQGDIWVLNKIDALTEHERTLLITTMQRHLKHQRVVGVSALNKQYNDLIEAISESVREYYDIDYTFVLSEPRHIGLAKKIQTILLDITSKKRLYLDYPEILAQQLREMVGLFDEFLDKFDVEEVLDYIFHHFCIGK